MQKVQEAGSFYEKSSRSSLSSQFQSTKKSDKIFSDDQIYSNIVAQFLCLKSRRSIEKKQEWNIDVSDFGQSSNPIFIERGAETSYKTSVVGDYSFRSSSKKNSYDSTDQIKSTVKQKNIKQINEHLLTVEEVLLKYQSNITYGIDNAAQKLKTYGQNRMEIFERRVFWKILVNQFNLFTFMMLSIGTLAFVAYDIGSRKDRFFLVQGTVVYFVILIQSIIMVIQEIKIKQSNEKFSKQIWNQEIQVIREGIQQKIASELLVPGDIIIVEENDRVPADVRIIESNQLMIDNSLYTGESQAVILTTEVTINSEMNEAKNIALYGTHCVFGNGKAIVIRTGRKTILSQIAKKTQNLNKNKSRLEKEIQKFIRIQTLFCCVLIIIGVIVWFFTYDRPDTDFIINYIIDITLASIPITLVLIVKLSFRIISSKMPSRGLFFRNAEKVDTISKVSMLIYDEQALFKNEDKMIEKLFINNQTVDFKYNKDQQIIFEFYSFLQLRQQNKFQQNNSIDCDDKNFIKQLEEIISKDQIYTIKEKQERIIAQFAFEYSDLYSLTIIQEDDCYVLQFSGIPEELWNLSESILINQQVVVKTNEHEKQYNSFLRKSNLSLESTIAFARTTLNFTIYPRGYQFDFQELRKTILFNQNLTFLGILSYNLPIDLNSVKVLRNLQYAGIRPVYISQEHPLLAKTLMQRLGLVDQIQIVSGEDLSVLLESHCEENEEQVEGQLTQMCDNKFNLFARINASQKLMLINAFKKTGHCVAVTGVQKKEAPCLKFCDVGISLVSASELCKDSAQIVLLDHKQVPIELIFQSFEYGRRFTSNILKLLLFSIPIKVGQTLPILFMLFFGIPLPLTSSGILLLSFLVVIIYKKIKKKNIFPSLSVVFDQSDPDLMFRNPKKKKEPLITTYDYLNNYTIPGIYACAAAMMCYFSTMTVLGFDSYVNLIRKDSYTSQYSNGFYDFNVSDPYLGNYNLRDNSSAKICNPIDKSFNPFAQNQSYKHIHQDNFDLRNVIVQCGPCSSLQIAANPNLKKQNCWITAFQLSDSSICPKDGANLLDYHCHSLLSLDIAQTTVILGLLLWYSSYMVINKNQNISFRYSQPNYKLLITVTMLIIITALFLVLPYLLEMKLPNLIFLAGFPGIPFIVLMFVNYELKKYYEKLKRRKWEALLND